jgi:hypothetical protein
MLYRNAIVAVLCAAALCGSNSIASAFDDSKYPDLSGQWRRTATGAARYDPSKPNGRGQQAPLTPEYRLLHEASMADQAAGGQGLDNAYKCIPMGMPRQMSGTFPIEFVVTPKLTHILFELVIYSTRRIYTDGRAFPTDEDPTYAGYSIGNWLDTDGDGRYDVLEVETRMTTIDDALTHPWTVTKDFRRQTKVLWTDNNCTEGNTHVAVGKDNYFVSADGYLMPVRKDQPAPDLRYFKTRK